MIRHVLAALILTWAGVAHGQTQPPAHPPAQTPIPEEIVPLPYPDRIEALNAPVNVRLAYGTAPKRRFINEIIWGPETAPGLYRMRTAGTVEVDTTSGAPAMTLMRGATDVTFGPKTSKRTDEGSVTAEIGLFGGFKQFQLRLPGLDAMVHRLQVKEIGAHLIDTGRIPPFKRLSRRTGPDDTGGNKQTGREATARIDILEALQPMLGMVLDYPLSGISTGTRLTVIRRDLGDLFRDSGPIPIRVEGQAMGLAEFDNRRFLVVKLNRAEMTPPMRANVTGHALIDIETAIPETIIAQIELIVLHGTDTSVFRFVEQRVLMPKQPTE